MMIITTMEVFLGIVMEISQSWTNVFEGFSLTVGHGMGLTFIAKTSHWMIADILIFCHPWLQSNPLKLEL